MSPAWLIHLVPAVLLLLTTCYAPLVVFRGTRQERMPRWLFPERASRLAKISVGIFASVLIVTTIVLSTFFIGIKRSMTHELSWSYGDGRDKSCQPEIVLTFVEYPNYYETFCSENLLRYLESLGGKTVPVKFEITYTFGSVASISIKQIGQWQHGATGWRGGGRGCRGKFPPCDGEEHSPWDS